MREQQKEDSDMIDGGLDSISNLIGLDIDKIAK